jgi:alpha-L-rhamnosidase
MMPDGTINPGEMTSFNHYALGAVANFMHSTIGGIMLLEPGWKRLLISPRPGGTITSATVSHVSPYGTIECSWFIKEQELIVNVVVPPNTCARVVLPGVDVEIGSGKKLFVAKWEADVRWPPKPIYSSMTIPLIDEIA